MGNPNQLDYGGIDVVVKSVTFADTPGGTQTALSSGEVSVLDGVTGGTATASKAVVLGASKEIATLGAVTMGALTAAATTLSGDMAIATSKFTVAAATGNTLVAGTLDVTGNVAVATNKFTVAASTGNTVVAGTLGVTGVATFSANPTFAAGKTLDLDSAAASLTSNAVTLTKYAGLITTESLSTAGGASQAFVLTLTGVAAGDLAFITPCGGTNTTKNITWDAITTTDTITVTVYNNTAATALNGTLKFNVWVVKA